jgi:hypothetical protein
LWGALDTIVSGKDPHGNVLYPPVAFVYVNELAPQTVVKTANALSVWTPTKPSRSSEIVAAFSSWRSILVGKVVVTQRVSWDAHSIEAFSKII